ncbi:MAG: IS1634 family transposase [Chitinivibrionales bacterium]|nr:IS1634 family transposase [Chitinivibrionales bacterium]
MYLRRINKKKSGKNHFYWALVESYRTEKGPRQRIVGYVGDVSRAKARKIKQTVDRFDSIQQDFLAPEELPEFATIETRKIRTERQREFGGVWLGNKLFCSLGLSEFFGSCRKKGRETVDWQDVIKILVLSRFCHPSSELYIAEHFYEQAAFEDYLGIPASKIYDNRLYRGLDKLLPHKDSLERHLKQRLGSLFSIDYDLFLYDVTSTYFEGQMDGSSLAQRGYSRDSRPDCKQVCIALVVTKEGLPLGYEVFAGNRHDSTTVKEIVEKMERQYGSADRIWVMDRGMISEKNLGLLKSRRYIIGTPKASLKNFERQLIQKSDWRVVREGVEAKICRSPEEETEEVFILCRSKERARKERAMHDRFIKRIEQGVDKLHRACERAKGRDITKAIERRVGRMLAQNSRAAGFFSISTRYDSQERRTVLDVQKKDHDSEWQRLTEGHYILRTNITDWEPQRLWEAYINLTDAEEAFRIHKSDLHLRPIWHQKDDRIRAHIFVCFLSFVLWKAFGLMCKNAGLGDEPRRVFKEIARICMVDVVLTTAEGKELKIRTVPRPDKPLQIILHRLGLHMPERLTKRVL